ncbi:MAG TPA: replication factor C large subunit [Candidatus Thermoplasmatota archaeon]
MGSALPWVEKYRPKRLEDVVGNGPAVAALKKWAASWEDGVPPKRAAVLSGRPGVGKTSAALALAADLGWGVIELNASDSRNEEAIRRIAGSGALNETFRDDGAFIRASAGGRKLIVMDEADNIFGREDRGGVPAMIDTVKRTRQPVVLIVNDYYALTRRASTLKGLALEIKFQALRSNQVEKVLRQVAAQEGVEVHEAVVRAIAQEAGGDLRAAINDLEAAAAGRRQVPEAAAAMAGGRDDRQSAYGMVGEVLHTFDVLKARQALWDLDESPDFALLWIDENVPFEYRHAPDLERALYYIARTDVLLGRAARRQLFGLWRYASDLMGPGVALSKSERVHGYTRYSFPMWLLRMGRSKAVRRQRAETYGKLGAYFHTSRREVGLSVMPFLPRLMESDFDLAVHVAAAADLEAEDLAEVLGRDADSREVLAIREQARALTESGASLGQASESRRGARKGSLSLGEAAALAHEKQEGAGKKARGKRKRAGGQEEEPAPGGPESDDPETGGAGGGDAGDAKGAGGGEGPADEGEGPAPQKSIFEF